MSRKMLINATHPEENRVAIVEDGILTELDIEVVGREQTKGNIYKATVVRVEQGLQAAFIDYGAERLGFLQMGELHPNLFKAADPDGSRGGKLRINDVLRRGQELLVQIVKGERGTKGAALTTHISLAGRYMVLMPDSDSKGVSRKIEEDSVRKKLKSTMSSLDLPEQMGYIVRTAGIDQSKEELKRDFDYLVRVYDNILTHGKKVKAPVLIYKESNLVIRSIRDYFTADIDEVLVDDQKVLQEAKEFFQQVMPECVKLVKLHTEKRPIFSRYQIEEQIETISKNKVTLPSGGSIVIDRTEALVAIDVNSGKMSGEQGIEATAFKTNLEAAEEVGRQLRLRDLGGLIVIDFIDMRDRKHNREIEKRLKDALKFDKAKTTVGKISSFGMLEMSRQRIKDALAEWSFLPCPHCEGSGRIKSPEAQAVAFLRKLQAGLAKGQIARVEGEVPLEVANYLLNSKRHELVEMEQRLLFEIVIRGRSDLIAGQMELSFVRREREDDLYLPPVTALLDATEPYERPEPRLANEVVPASVAAPEKPGRGRRKTNGTEAENSAVLAVEETSHADLSHETAATGTTETPFLDAGEAGAEESKRKRKRRRRKKKPGVTSDEQSLGESDESPPDEASDESALGTAPEVLATEGASSRKKRKRRRKKKPATGVEGSVQIEAIPAANSTRDSVEEHATVAVTESATEIKAPRPRRASKAASSSTPPEVNESATVTAPAKTQVSRGRKVAPAAAESASADTESSAQPPAKSAPRARKPAAKPAAAAGPEPSADATAAKSRGRRKKTETATD